MKAIEGDFSRNVKEFVATFTKGQGKVIMEKGKSAKLCNARVSFIARKKTPQEQIEESTFNYFEFLNIFAGFVTGSKQIMKLRFDEVLIKVAIEDLLDYWMKQHITPNTQIFSLNMIDAICKKVVELSNKYRNF